MHLSGFKKKWAYCLFLENNMKTKDHLPVVFYILDSSGHLLMWKTKNWRQREWLHKDGEATARQPRGLSSLQEQLGHVILIRVKNKNCARTHWREHHLLGRSNHNGVFEGNHKLWRILRGDYPTKWIKILRMWERKDLTFSLCDFLYF